MKNKIDGVTEVVDIDGLAIPVVFTETSLEEGIVWCRTCGSVFHKNGKYWGRPDCKHCGSKLDWSAVEE